MRAAQLFTIILVGACLGLVGCESGGSSGSSAGSSSGGSGGQTISINLGGGVSMSFIWIEAVSGWVGKYEVTNDEYRRYDPTHDSGAREGADLNGERQPVVRTSGHDATGFAGWVSMEFAGQLPTGTTVTLPSAEEWAVIAQCGDGREYPWGDTWPPPGDWNYNGEEGLSNYYQISGHNDGFPVTCPVEDSGVNDWGLYGVGGNVLERTVDEIGMATWVYGGAWIHSAPSNIRCSSWSSAAGSAEDNTLVGFRLLIK